LILALFAGEIMMKSGAEVYRVEDTIDRICRACKIDYVECFATPTGLFVSLDSGTGDSDMHTFVKRIRGTRIDLEKISLVNAFSRVFTTTDLSIEDGFEQLRAIKARPGYSEWLRVVATVLVGVFFCPIYKGGVLDMVMAGGISAVSYLISCGVARLKFPDFLRILISCAGAAGLVLLAAVLGMSDSVSPVLIAATTIFLPGVAITNAARDLISGDMVSGVARLAEALLAAVAIAGGVGVGVKIWFLMGGSMSGDRVVIFATGWFLLFGFFGSLGFGILFNAPKRMLVPTALIGAFGMFIYMVLLPRYGMVNACFFGTCAIAVLAEIFCRVGKDATTVFIIPGIIPFVPGVSLYETMSAMLSGNYSGAMQAGTQALTIAGSMALALGLIATFVRLIMTLVHRIGHWRREIS